MVTTLIILNIILIIIILAILAFYIFRNKKDVIENKKDVIESICENEDTYCEIDSSEYKQNKKIKQDRVFDGRFVTDEEYQQMIKSKRSDISILIEELYNEYEHLKELNK